MRNYNLTILAISVALGAYAFIDSVIAPLMVASVIAIPSYVFGNMIARKKGLDTNDPKVPGTDPAVRLKNYGMSALPVIATIIGSQIHF